jgi:hypothetical protein
MNHLARRIFSMKRSMSTDQKIAFALQQAEQGTQVAEVTQVPAIGRGECPAAPAGSGSLPGQGNAPGGHPKKTLKPAQVDHGGAFAYLLPGER